MGRVRDAERAAQSAGDRRHVDLLSGLDLCVADLVDADGVDLDVVDDQPPGVARCEVDEHTGELLFFDYGTDAPFMHYGVVDRSGTLTSYVDIELPDGGGWRVTQIRGTRGPLRAMQHSSVRERE